MSIQQQVADAQYLAENGRYIGALTTLMLAVAASANKTFPKGTKSFTQPATKKCGECGRGSKGLMGDGEAFTRFLGGRIRRILFNDRSGDKFGDSGFVVSFKGKSLDIAQFLYKYYRCELVHQGDLPEDVEFVPPRGVASGLSVGISSGSKFALDYGWINLLIKAVVEAPCNGEEFGIKHYKLTPKDGSDDQAMTQKIVKKYDISPGRCEIMKEVVMKLTDDLILNLSDELLAEEFRKLVASREISGGAITGLSTRGITSRDGKLSPFGVLILKDLASVYARVEI